MKQFQGVVYLITNLTNKKVYVGQTINNYKSRWRDHTLCNLTDSFYIHNAIKKYGKENFKIEVLCVAENQDELNFLETLFIEVYHSTDSRYGYNLREGGSRGCHSEESKRLMSHVHSAMLQDPIYRENLRKGQKGRIPPSQKGKIWITNGERHKRISPGEPIPEGYRVGKTPSKDVGKNISRAKKGKPNIRGREIGRKVWELLPEEEKIKRINFLLECSKKGAQAASKKNLDTIFINNGVVGKRIKKFLPIPKGWDRGRIVVPQLVR